MKKLLLTAVMLMAVVFVLTSCTKKDPCEMFADPLLSDIGTVMPTVTGSDVSVDWDGTVEEFDSYTVELDGTIVMDQKPANFTGLADGSYTATVTYSKVDCTDLTATASVTIDTSCATWPGTLSFTATATVTNQDVTIDIDAVPSGGTDVVISVTPQGAGSTPADQTALPATFTALANDTYDVLVSYSKGTCTGTVDATTSFTINFTPVSLSVDVEPMLNDGATYDCSGCHTGAAWAANLDMTTANLYANLIGAATDTTCVPAEANRVVPGDSANSMFYLVLVGACGATGQMPDGGWPSYLTAAEMQLVADWIDQGAMDN